MEETGDWRALEIGYSLRASQRRDGGHAPRSTFGDITDRVPKEHENEVGSWVFWSIGISHVLLHLVYVNI